MAWLAGYSKRKPITLTGGASGAQTDFQLKLAAAYAAAMQSDFDDLRFTQADGTTLIDAWLESKVDDTSATVWVEFPTTPANTVEQTYYMCYGNGSAASDWDIGATFVFGDDFNRANSGTVGNGWTENYDASYSIEDNTLKMVWVSGHNYAECYRSHTPGEYIYEWKEKATATNAIGYFGTIDATNNNRPEWMWANGYIKYLNSAGHQDLLSYSADTWYDLQMIYRRGDDRVDYKADSTTATNQSPFTATGANRVRFVTGTAASTFYIDNYRIRKYAANPPTYAFGSEESAPAVGAIMNQFQKANVGADLYNGAIIA